MQLSFALFADAANISQEGKLNILGVFDAVQVASLPAVHPRAYLVVRLKAGRNDVGNHTLAFNWANPNGETLWSTTGQLNVGAPPAGVAEMDMPLIAAIDLPIDQAGTFAMGISLDGRTTATISLQVRTAPQPVPVIGAPGVPGAPGIPGIPSGGLLS